MTPRQPKPLTAAKLAGKVAELEFLQKQVRNNAHFLITQLAEIINEPGGIHDPALTKDVGIIAAAIRHLNQLQARLDQLQAAGKEGQS